MNQRPSLGPCEEACKALPGFSEPRSEYEASLVRGLARTMGRPSRWDRIHEAVAVHRMGLVERGESPMIAPARRDGLKIGKLLNGQIFSPQSLGTPPHPSKKCSYQTREMAWNQRIAQVW